MDSLLIVFISFLALGAGYKFYGDFIAKRLFGTTLDTATRLQRYVISEAFEFKMLSNRYASALFAITTVFLLCLINGGAGSGGGGLILRPLFGAVNQLVLLIASTYLWRSGNNMLYTFPPMLIIIITSWALLINLVDFADKSNWPLLGFDLVVLLLEIWMRTEAVLVFKGKREKVPAFEQSV